MRILQLISSSGFFGAENVVVQLAAALHALPNLRVVPGVIENSANPHREVADLCRGRGMAPVIFTSSRKLDCSAVAALRQFIRDNEIDIVHAHGYKANFYSLLAARGLPAKLVATCHNWPGRTVKNKIYAWCDCLLLNGFDRIIAVSEEVKNTLKKFILRKRKIAVISNGVSPSEYEPGPCRYGDKNGRINKSTVVVGIVGRISQEKGHEYLLKVFRRISLNQENIVLLVVGDGPLRAELQGRYEQDAIIFTGLQSDLPPLYRAMDIFVLPSFQEGSPMVLLEAMAAGLPVVAARVGGVAAVVEDGISGMLITAGNERELEAALRFLLHNRGERKRMGARGRQRVAEHFSARRMAQRYAAIYRATMGG